MIEKELERKRKEYAKNVVITNLVVLAVGVILISLPEPIAQVMIFISAPLFVVGFLLMIWGLFELLMG